MEVASTALWQQPSGEPCAGECQWLKGVLEHAFPLSFISFSGGVDSVEMHHAASHSDSRTAAFLSHAACPQASVMPHAPKRPGLF